MHAVENDAAGSSAPETVAPKPAVFRYFLIVCVLAAIAVFIFVLKTGVNYYTTDVTQRYRSDLHQRFKPGGSTGHMLGMTGSVMLIGLLSYSVRKRARFLKRWGTLSRWLQFHIFLGIAGPAFITLHTAFKLRGIVAISYWSMMLVAVSGMIGRYLYAQIPHALSGSNIRQQDLNLRIEQINERFADVLNAADLERIQQITAFADDSRVYGARALLLMISDDFRWIQRRSSIQRILRSYPSLNQKERRDLAALAHERQLQLRKASLLRASQNLFRYWHVIHLPLAQTMYITMVIHITVAILTGYF